MIFVFATIQSTIPYLEEAKNELTKFFHEGKFVLISISIFLLALTLFVYGLFIRAKEKKRLKREEEYRIYRKLEEKRKKRLEELEAHLKPKPKEEYAETDFEPVYEKPQREVTIKVNLNQRFFRKKNINEYEEKYLLRNDYQEFSYKGISSKKKETYFLKPRHNESINHMIIIYDISQYLKKKGITHFLYATKMPDIVVHLNGKEIAFEVETGTVLTNMKKFREKLNLLNENYKDNWYFIVTNRNKIKRYRKFGKVIDPRYIKNQIDKILKIS